MKFYLADDEKKLIEDFRKLKYPAIYKLDDTDNILFVELVDFDVCPWLLKGKPIDNAQYRGIVKEYKKYLEQVRLDSFDEYALNHYNLIVKIMNLFKKYYSFVDSQI